MLTIIKHFAVPDFWVGECRPDAVLIEEFERDLLRQIGYHGLRWQYACAVYPVIQWDLTQILGESLLDEFGRPINTEDRSLRLSGLPWMRMGELPEWMREHFISRIDQRDSTTVRVTLTAPLDQVRKTNRPPSHHEMTLTFGINYGADLYRDKHFARFVERTPHTKENALAASSHLQQVLKGQHPPQKKASWPERLGHAVNTRIRGVRVVEIVGLFLALGMIFWVCLSKVHEGEDMKRINQLDAQIAEEAAKISELKVKIAELESPARLEALAKEYVNMAPTAPDHEATLEALPDLVRNYGATDSPASVAPATPVDDSLFTITPAPSP